MILFFIIILLVIFALNGEAQARHDELMAELEDSVPEPDSYTSTIQPVPAGKFGGWTTQD